MFADAGAVNVLYGTAGGLNAKGNQVWFRGSLRGGGIASGDQFGTALTAGDFQNDGFDDLAIGAPEAGSGRVRVLFGGSDGLTGSSSEMLEQPPQPSNTSGDRFGLSLSAARWGMRSGIFDQLVVGAPLRTSATGGAYYFDSTPLVVMLNAASFADIPAAAESIVSLFGQDLASEAAIASETPLPTSLAGTSVEVTDSRGNVRLASLFYAGPTQVNYLMPEGTTLGDGFAVLNRESGPSIKHRIRIYPVSPGFFTANSSGMGLAAGLAIRVAPGGEQSFETLADASVVPPAPIPIDMMGNPDSEFYLALFGTGIRGVFGVNRNVTATIQLNSNPPQQWELNVLAALAQGDFEGLDQVNLGPLPPILAGLGGGASLSYSVRAVAEGFGTNRVDVAIR